MRIPRTLKILGRTYKVEIVENLYKGKLLGSCHFYKGKIRIEKDISYSLKKKILFHELLHAADMESGAHLTENQVEKLENSFYAILKDNKFLR